MSNTEKLIKQLNENKELRKIKEEQNTKTIKPAIRIQELKNNLIILGHELKMNKKINDTLYRKIQLLTYSRTTEQKIKDSYTKLKDIQKDIKKAEQLQGPTKIKKVTLKDFKVVNKIKEVNNKKNEVIVKPYIIEFPFYKFYKGPTTEQLNEVSEHFLTAKIYKKGINRDYAPIEKTVHTRKKIFIYDFNGGVTKLLGTYLMNIYKQQKFTFKLTIEFSFLLIDVDYTHFQSYIKNSVINVSFALFQASTNTRPKGFENPVVVDNKTDIDNIIKKLTSADLIEYFMLQRGDSRWKFYKFLDVKFHVYEMNTPIGKANELPDHFKEGSNEKALIKYENYDDYLCFWRCLSYHQTNQLIQEILIKR
jgi:hypothetical protein